MPVRSAARRLRFVVGLGVFVGSLVGALAPAPVAAQSASLAVADAAYDDARVLFDARLYARATDAFAAYRAAYPDGPRQAEALFYEAESALAAGDDDQAGVLFAQFRATYPSHALAGRAGLALGEFYYAQDRYDETEAALLEALDSSQTEEDAARATYLLGQAALQSGRTAAALDYFARTASAYPDTETAPLALYAAASLQARGNDWTGASSSFERLARRYPASPQNVEASLGLAEAYARGGRFDEAADELSHRVSQLEGEQRARGNLLWGDALLRLGRRDQARERFLAIPVGSAYVRRATFGLARHSFDEGDWASAVDRFAAVRAGTPEDDGSGAEDDAIAHEATYYEGLALKQLGQLGEAERRFNAASIRLPFGRYADAALLELGLLRYERRQYDEATDAFEALLDGYPNSAHAGEAARMLGEAFAALGNTRAAADAIRRAEALGAASPELGVEVAFQEAYGLYQRGDYARAIPRLVGVYNDDPRGPRAGEALFWAGESAFQAGDYGQADDLFQRFLNEFPDHRQAIAARYVVAWGHFKRRDYSASANAFERFLSAYTRSAESVPYFADALLRLGDSYYALRRFDNAISVYSRVASATSDQRGLDYARFQTGQAHNGAGRTAEAVASYDRLLRDFPNSPLRAQARYAKGFLLFQGGDYDAAITEYRTLIQAQPDSPIAPKALYGIGDAHYNAGRLTEAETAYRQVLTRYPNSPFVANALDGLEYALQGQGRGDEIGPIIAAYEARNSDPSARDGIRLRQAELAFENGDFQGAVDRLTAFVASAQDRSLVASALLTLGSAYGALGQLNDEARTYTRLVNDHTDSPLRGEAVLRLGETYLAMNQPRQAADALANYERRFPGDAERVARALWAEARALRTLGREADADIRLGRLFDAYGDTAAADEARQSFPDGTDGDR